MNMHAGLFRQTHKVLDAVRQLELAQRHGRTKTITGARRRLTYQTTLLAELYAQIDEQKAAAREEEPHAA